MTNTHTEHIQHWKERLDYITKGYFSNMTPSYKTFYIACLYKCWRDVCNPELNNLNSVNTLIVIQNLSVLFGLCGERFIPYVPDFVK